MTIFFTSRGAHRNCATMAMFNIHSLTLGAQPQRGLLNIFRGVKQGSVLSPTLFLTAMDLLLKRLRESKCGLYVRGTYMGGAVHADDLRTTAASSDAISK